MGWIYAFYGLGAFAPIGLVIDVLALRRHVAGRLPVAALVLKGVVVTAFATWAAYFSIVPPREFEDLATLAGIVLLAVPVLSLSMGFDLVALRGLTASRR